MAYITTTHTAAHRPARRAQGILSTLLRWAAVARQRRHLARLDDAALADIGITRAQAQEEAQRAVWDAPTTWRV